MPFETREGQGALFVNDRKDTEQQPDYRGNVRINGVLYRLSGWKRRSSSGNGWLSLAIQPDQRAESPQTAAPASAQRPEPDFDDDILF